MQLEYKLTLCRSSSARNADVLLFVDGGRIVKNDAQKSFFESSSDSSGPSKEPLNIETPVTPKGRTKLPMSQLPSQKVKSYGGRHANSTSDASTSKFKPDAPEFVPNYKRGTEASSSQLSHAHPSLGHQNSHKGNKSGHPNNSSHATVSAPSDRVVGKRPQKPQAAMNESGKAPLKSTEEASLNKTESDYDGPADHASAAKKPHQNRWQRRRQARSDTPAAAAGLDDVEEKKQAPHTSPSRVRQALRHVSGPGQLPTGHMTESKTSPTAGNTIGQAPRPRRQRHLRIRKQHEPAASRSKIGTNESYPASSIAAESSSTLSSNTVVANGHLPETASEQGRQSAE